MLDHDAYVDLCALNHPCHPDYLDDDSEAVDDMGDGDVGVDDVGDGEPVCMWPCGTHCPLSMLSEYLEFMSDDYQILGAGSNIPF